MTQEKKNTDSVYRFKNIFGKLRQIISLKIYRKVQLVTHVTRIFSCFFIIHNNNNVYMISRETVVQYFLRMVFESHETTENYIHKEYLITFSHK